MEERSADLWSKKSRMIRDQSPIKWWINLKVDRYKERELEGEEKILVGKKRGNSEQEKAAAYIYRERPYPIPVLIPLDSLENKTRHWYRCYCLHGYERGRIHFAGKHDYS